MSSKSKTISALKTFSSRPSKCPNHHNQRLCKIFLAGINLFLQTYCVLLQIWFFSTFSCSFLCKISGKWRAKVFKSFNIVFWMIVYVSVWFINYWNHDCVKFGTFRRSDSYRQSCTTVRNFVYDKSWQLEIYRQKLKIVSIFFSDKSWKLPSGKNCHPISIL